MKYLTATVAAIGLTVVAASPLHAASDVASNNNVNAGNLVNVNVSNVANDLAENLDVNVSQIPVSVQVPVGIAAAVCDIDANVLAQQRKQAGGSSCDAQNTTQGLNQQVQRQLLNQGG